MKKLLICFLFSFSMILYGQQLINVGSNPNDKTGDPLRTAFQKVNTNLTAIYDSLGNRAPLTGTASGLTVGGVVRMARTPLSYFNFYSVSGDPINISHYYGEDGFLMFPRSATYLYATNDTTYLDDPYDAVDNVVKFKGNLGYTTGRLAKGWFTNLEITNLPTINGGALKTALSLTASDVGLSNITNKLQVEREDSSGFSPGNYMPRKSTADLIDSSLDAAKEAGIQAVALPDTGLTTSGGYVSGFDWYNGITSNVIKAAKKVTTVDPVLAYPIACVGGILTGQTTMTDGRAQYITFYIPEPITITGVRFVLQTQGNYTADEYNGAKLYQVTSASTFVRLDSTANNGDFWKGSVVTKNDFAFVGGERLLEPGLYVIGFIWNASATTAAPVMYSSFNNSSATNVMYFGNGGADQTKLAGYLSTQTDLAVSEAFNDLTSDTVSWGIFLY